MNVLLYRYQCITNADHPLTTRLTATDTPKCNWCMDAAKLVDVISKEMKEI